MFALCGLQRSARDGGGAPWSISRRMPDEVANMRGGRLERGLNTRNIGTHTGPRGRCTRGRSSNFPDPTLSYRGAANEPFLSSSGTPTCSIMRTEIVSFPHFLFFPRSIEPAHPDQRIGYPDPSAQSRKIASRFSRGYRLDNRAALSATLLRLIAESAGKSGGVANQCSRRGSAWGTGIRGPARNPGETRDLERNRIPESTAFRYRRKNSDRPSSLRRLVT
jgi:hypothetical protein